MIKLFHPLLSVYREVSRSVQRMFALNKGDGAQAAVCTVEALH